MKKTMKRLALILLAAAMLAGAFTCMASARYVASPSTKLPYSINHKNNNGTVTLHYTVSLKIGQEIAEFADQTRYVPLDNELKLKMKTVRYVCYLEDEVLKDIDINSIGEIQNNEIFDLVYKTKTEKGVKFVYRVKPALCDQWATWPAGKVAEQLTATNMYIEGEDTIPATTLRDKCYTSGNGTVYLKSEGCLMIYFEQEEDITASTKGMEYDYHRLNERGALMFRIFTDSTLSSLKSNEELSGLDAEIVEGNIEESAYITGVGFWVDGFEPVLNPGGYWVDRTIPAHQDQAPTNDTYRITTVPYMLNDAEHFTYIFGYDDGDVRPGKSITRAEVATIFYRLLKDDVRSQYFSTTNTFSDVSADNWFNITVSTMANAGIVNGYPDGTFRPNAPITRAEFATIIARFDGGTTTGAVTFPDVYGHWAKSYVDRAAELGWINGYTDGTFRPNQNITRAETAAMINRVLNRAPQSTADLLSNMKVWPDNTNVSAWYYLDMQEATNSHTYSRKDNGYETWKQIVPNKTWTE